MADVGVSIALIGATGALGEELLVCLEDAEFEIRELVPIASRASTRPSVDFKGQSLRVRNLEPEALERANLVLLALPPGREEDLLLDIAEAGTPIVDLTGLWADDAQAPLVAAGLNDGALDALRGGGPVVCPHPLALALAGLGRALRPRFELRAVRGQALLPAASAGRRGIEELSGQIVASFHSKDPPRVVFPEGLAFNLLPTWGELEPGGWTDLERRVADQAARLLGSTSQRFGVGVALAPLFAGMSLALHLEADGQGFDAEQLTRTLSTAPALRLVGGRALTPRAQLEQGGLAVGRVRDDPAGQGVHLWVSADPLRLAASNAVALAGALLGQGLL